MRRAIRSLACAVGSAAAFCAPAARRSRRTVSSRRWSDGRLITLNADGSGLRTLPFGDARQDQRARVVARRQPARVRQRGADRGPRPRHRTAADGRLRRTDAREPGLVGRRAADPLPARSAATASVPSSGGVGELERARRCCRGRRRSAWAPEFTRAAIVVAAGADPAGRLDGAGHAGRRCAGVGARRRPGRRSRRGNGIDLVAAAAGQAAGSIADPAAGAPRWSPDSTSLVYAAGTELRTVFAPGRRAADAADRRARRCRATGSPAWPRP